MGSTQLVADIREALTELEAVTAAVSRKANTHRVGKPLKLDFEGLNCARRGTYRGIYRIDDDTHRVDGTAIEHRADAYCPRHS